MKNLLPFLALALAPLAPAEEPATPAPAFRQTLAAPPAETRDALRRPRPVLASDGKIRIHAAGKLLVDPASGARVVADRYLRQIVGAPADGLVAVTDTDWGLLVPDKAAPGRAVFQPVAALPLEECRIAPATSGDLLFFGRRPAGGYALLRLDPVAVAPADFAPLLRSESPLTAVTADETHAFVATDGLVRRVALAGDGAPPKEFCRIRETITEIHADGHGGLAVATATQVLLVNAAGEARPILATNNARLALAGGTLHILREDLSALSLRLAPPPSK